MERRGCAATEMIEADNGSFPGVANISVSANHYGVDFDELCRQPGDRRAVLNIFDEPILTSFLSRATSP